MPAVAIPSLRSLIDQRFPDAALITQRTGFQLATGIKELDRAFPSGGLPRGRLSVWEPQGGATSLLRAACHGALAMGERAAWIDTLGAVAGSCWDEGPLLVRPTNRLNALRSAEELLRSGGFALVVLAGAEPRSTETVRLTRATRDGGSALVALTAHTAMSALRISSRIQPNDYLWRRTPFGDLAEVTGVLVRVRVHAPALGWKAHADVVLPVSHHELRLSLEPGLADRRGVSR